MEPKLLKFLYNNYTYLYLLLRTNNKILRNTVEKTMTMPCPCGNDTTFDKCCEPIHNNHRLADTAEKLMRSRYSAFVVKNEPFLLKTWSKKRRPAKMYIAEQKIEWLGLKIHDTTAGGTEDKIGEVEFSAQYREDGVTHTLKERSRFRKTNTLWFYVDGKIKVEES